MRAFWPLAGLLACLLLMAASLLGRWILPLDTLAHFRLHLSLMALVFGFAAWWSQRALTVIAGGIVAVPLLIGLGLPVLNGAGAPAQPPVNGRSFTIVSFNTWLRQYEWREIERYLRAVKPDFVVMLEAGRAIKPLFAALRDLYPWQKECASWRYCHIAVLSRHRWRTAAFENRTARHGPLVWARFGPALGGLTLIGTHFDRPPMVANQLREARALAKRVRGLPGPVIVAGDFNATPWSHVYKTFAAASRLHSFSAIAPSWPTYPLNLPQMPIDHVFVSRALSVRLLENGPTLGSDHRAIRAQILMPER